MTEGQTHTGLYNKDTYLLGEWKLFGLEQMRSTTAAQGTPNAEPRSSMLSKYNPPELKNSPHAETTPEQDMWGLGCIVWEVYNGPLGKKFSPPIPSND